MPQGQKKKLPRNWTALSIPRRDNLPWFSVGRSRAHPRWGGVLPKSVSAEAARGFHMGGEVSCHGRPCGRPLRACRPIPKEGPYGSRRMGLQRNPHSRVRESGLLLRRESKNDAVSRVRQPPVLWTVLRRCRSPMARTRFERSERPSCEELPDDIRAPYAVRPRRTLRRALRRVPSGATRPWTVSSGPKSGRSCPQSTPVVRSDIPKPAANSRR
jgi:hypothetical protein